jgi:hypothetical protein
MRNVAWPPAVCVIPVRMQEAWLLFSETAIRGAAGNPQGRIALNLPRWTRVEALPDPKETLHGILREASGLHGRRLDRFNVHHAAGRIPMLVPDFEPLLQLEAFRRFQGELTRVLGEAGWLSA